MNKVPHKLDRITLQVMKPKYVLYLTLLSLCLLVGRLISNPITFRWVVIGVLIFLLFLVTINNVRKGVIAILIFVPFAAFLRRVLYFVSPYAEFDPIHLIVPILALFIAVEMLLFGKERLSQTLKGNYLAKYIIALLVLFVLQIFNPLQGSLLVGLGGALYYVAPMVWFFFGLRYVNNQLLHKLMIAIVAIGVVTGIYGLCQMTFGFPSFEKYWIEHGGFVSLRVGRFIRAFSTFANPEEYSRYLQVGGVIAFGYFLKSKNLKWFLAGIFISFVVLMTGVRASVFGLFFSVLILLAIWRATNLGHAFVWVILLVGSSFLIQTFLSPPGGQGIYQSESIFYTMGLHTARGFINPTTELSFQSRLNIWSYLFTSIVRGNPVGYGLGSTSIAATKFGRSEIGTDSYIVSTFVNSGIAGGLLFLIITLIAIKRGAELSLQSKDNDKLYPIVLAITVGLALTNIFGQSFSLYSVAPIGWLLIGYIAKQRDSQNRVQQYE